MPAAIVTERLTKVYAKQRGLREIAARPFRRAERITALTEVGLEAGEGEIFGLLGPNGAGKTTFLKILACLVLPTTGRASVFGHDVARDDVAVRRAIGFVTSDERSFYWRLTGRENLEFFARLYGLDPAASRRRVAALLEAVELRDVGDQQCMSYSSGMKQRLAIARALLHDPAVLCMDEPTRSLDPIAAKHLRRFIGATLNQGHGKTVLLATHNLQEAEELCGRLAILDRGRVLRQGTLAEITAGLPGRDHYVMLVAGLREAPVDPRWSVEIEARDGAPARVTAEVERGGAAFSDLLRALLRSNVTIVTCNRREPSLQDIFDYMDAGAGPGGGPGPGGAA
ncbi:MAG: ATP-binding cassette domain-containing protein [Candidatus Polarisedimenticolia bacterium]